MLLVADSGSTKCDWKLIDNKKKEIAFIQTKGFNPFFENSRDIFDDLKKNSTLCQYSPEVTRLYYYGAGCSSPKRKDIVDTAFRSFFRNADITVEHDLLGAALATCDNKPGIACILGTGSNAGYFDGKELDDDVHALGYILGDEGSGSWLGKKLIADYLYKKLPPKMNQELQERYNMDKEEIFEKVYRNQRPNMYLASFARFLSDNVDHYYVRQLVRQGLLEFIDIHVCRFENYQNVPVHFVGSVAYFFEEILRDVIDKKGIQLGKIIKEPIHSLTDHFLEVEKV